MNARKPNRYEQILERIFADFHKEGDSEVVFERPDIERVAGELKIDLPKNLGDVLYSFRYRADLPASISDKAPAGLQWVILPKGRSRYAFSATALALISPTPGRAETKVPDATPGVIEMYALNDEQALLAKLRYNRLIDIFTGVTCYPLQSHLRTAVIGMGQVETDEIYIGLDRHGVHYVLPVQAKGGKDRMSIVQIAQDFAMCESKFPDLICRPIAAQFMRDSVIALFEFERSNADYAISSERHYRLVPAEKMSREELRAYQERLS